MKKSPAAEIEQTRGSDLSKKIHEHALATAPRIHYNRRALLGYLSQSRPSEHTDNGKATLIEMKRKNVDRDGGGGGEEDGDEDDDDDDEGEKGREGEDASEASSSTAKQSKKQKTRHSLEDTHSNSYADVGRYNRSDIIERGVVDDIPKEERLQSTEEKVDMEDDVRDSLEDVENDIMDTDGMYIQQDELHDADLEEKEEQKKILVVERTVWDSYHDMKDDELIDHLVDAREDDDVAASRWS